MSDELTIEGTQYVSSKRASEMSGYAQDYIGQLSRGGHINAQRIGGLWYVSMESLNSYKAKAEAYVPPPPPPQPPTRKETESVITFDGKDYISAAKAAELTGYHQDYVGQLARGGKVLSRQIGNRWYVDREGIRAHKEEKDRLLAAVQVESVGIQKPRSIPTPSPVTVEPLYTYANEDGTLVPPMFNKPIDSEPVAARTPVEPVRPTVLTREPEVEYMRVAPPRFSPPRHVQSSVRPVAIRRPSPPPRSSGKTIYIATSGILAVAIIGLLGAGYFFSTANRSIAQQGSPGRGAFMAAAVGLVDTIGDILEPLVTDKLSYVRQ